MSDYTSQGYRTIIFERGEHGVASITLNRPERMNSYSHEMCREMRNAWIAIREDDGVRAVVLKAAPGRAFCTGVDVFEPIDQTRNRPFDELDPGEMLGPKHNFVWKPVVTAVHGLCAGGAFYFLNESDIIICSEEAQFFDPHVSFGLVPACEPVGASRRMPYGDIMRMILLGNSERIGAETALRTGLVSEILSADRLWARADELAALIAQKPTNATQGAVRAMWESLDFPYTAAIRNAYKYTQIGNDLTYRATAQKEPFTVR